MKKRGFGQGRWNGFGGKVEKNENLEDTAKREVFEEAGIRVENIEKMGILNFSWYNKQELIEVHVFKTNQFNGTIKESEEMEPKWFDIDQIPFTAMWSDDIHWIPLLLDNKKFNGIFVFDDNDQILKHKIKIIKQI